MNDRDPQWGVFVQGVIMFILWAAFTFFAKISGVW